MAWKTPLSITMGSDHARSFRKPIVFCPAQKERCAPNSNLAEGYRKVGCLGKPDPFGMATGVPGRQRKRFQGEVHAKVPDPKRAASVGLLECLAKRGALFVARS